MTPSQISALSDEQLQRALAEVLGWKSIITAGGDERAPVRVWGIPPGKRQRQLIPDWPRDPTASAELRRELWFTAAALSIGWSLMSISVSLDRVTDGVRREYDAFVPMPIGADPIAAECRAVAEAALQLLQEGGK